MGSPCNFPKSDRGFIPFPYESQACRPLGNTSSIKIPTSRVRRLKSTLLAKSATTKHENTLIATGNPAFLAGRPCRRFHRSALRNEPGLVAPDLPRPMDLPRCERHARREVDCARGTLRLNSKSCRHAGLLIWEHIFLKIPRKMSKKKRHSQPLHSPPPSLNPSDLYKAI